MTDYRFPSPGVDARFPGGGVDNYFDNGGRFVGGKDLRFEAPGLGGGAPSVLTLDAPLSAAMSASDGLYAFDPGGNRVVEGSSGPTIRLALASNSAVQQDFSPDPVTGIFDIAQVNTWASNADTNLVKAYDQRGSALTVVAEGTVAFTRSGVAARFGTSADTSKRLTRTAGGIGVNLGDDTGNLRLAGLTLSQATGIEVHVALSFNERKVTSAAVANDAYSGNSSTENIFSWYRASTANGAYLAHYFGGSAQSNIVYATTTPGSPGTAVGSTTFNSNGASAGAVTSDQNAQEIFTYAVNSTNFYLYRSGRLYQSAAYAAAHTSNMSLAPLSNGDIVIGGRPTSQSNGAITTNRANMLVGPIIITGPLTTTKRAAIRARLNQVCQQHRIKRPEEIKAYFEELVLFKNADAGTGLAVGENGLLSLQFSGSFQYGYATPHSGYLGVYAPSDTDYSLTMKALSNYFAGVTTGTVVALTFRDGTGNAAGYANALAHAFVQGNGAAPTTAAKAADNWSMAFGAYDHNCMSFTSMVGSPTRDPSNLTSTRQYVDNTPFGSTFYDGSNQSMGKYIRNTSHNTFTYGEVIVNGASVTYTQAVWANADFSQGQKALDAPTGPAVLDNGSGNAGNGNNLWKGDCLALHIVSFEAPAGYNRAADYATRMALARQATNTSMVSIGETPLGHMDGSVAINRNAVVVDSTDDATIMSHNFQYGFKGVRIAAMFSRNVLTQAQKEEVQVNLYKLVA